MRITFHTCGNNIRIILFILFFSSGFPGIRAQNNGDTNNSQGSMVSAEKILAAHNDYRKESGLPLLSWSSRLTDSAAVWALEITKNVNCQVKFRAEDDGYAEDLDLGENIFKGSSNFTILSAVKLWGGQKRYYDSKTNSCTNGDCESYRKIIRKETTEVGCALARCPGGFIIVVCNYNNPENGKEEIANPVPKTDEGIRPDKILEAHNVYRRELELPLLSWSPELANYAEAWGNELVKNRNCKIQNRPHTANDPWVQKYGENIYSSNKPGFTVQNAVDIWGNYKNNFDRKTNLCNGGNCGYYAQMIGATTTKVGCALVKCPDGTSIVVCNYDPASEVKVKAQN